LVPCVPGVAPSGSGCPGKIFGVIIPPYSSVRDTSASVGIDSEERNMPASGVPEVAGTASGNHQRSTDFRSIRD
jgi:hypothetical protein